MTQRIMVHLLLAAYAAGFGGAAMHRAWAQSPSSSAKAHEQAAQPARKVDFVIDGKPAAAVVVPSDPAPLARAGADELVDFVKHCTGASLPVVQEGAGLPQGIEQSIYIGDTRAARAAGVNVDQLKPDEFRILARDHKLILAGRDKLPEGVDLLDSTQTHAKPAVWHGSYYAVISLIRGNLGGAFLWPGDLGTVYPQSRTLRASVSDRDFATPFVLRRLWNAARNHHRYIRPARKLGYSHKQIQHKQRVTSRYFLRQGGGANRRIEMGHSFTDWWKKYAKTHPNYFALQPTGVRGPVDRDDALGDPTRVKLHVANPDLIPPIMKEAKDLFHKHPDAWTFPIAINDGHRSGFCMDPLCRAWDEPAAAPYRLVFATQGGGRKVVNYHFLTDRYAHFWTRISKAFRKQYPDKLLFVFAYGALEQQPIKTSLPDDLLVSFVPSPGFYAFDHAHQVTMRRWDGWASRGAALLFRPNYMHFGKALPLVYVHKFARDIKHAYHTGMIGGVFDIIHNSWGTQGLDFYVTCRLMFNPELSVDQLVDQFCDKAFGKGAPAMKRYFAFLEHTTAGLAAAPKSTFHGGHFKFFGGDYVAASVKRDWIVEFTARLARAQPRLEAMFEQARQAVPEESRQAKRIGFFREGLQYALLMHDGFAADTKAQREAALQAMQAYLKKNRHTFVVARPFIKQALHKYRNGMEGFFLGDRK